MDHIFKSFDVVDIFNLRWVSMSLSYTDLWLNINPDEYIPQLSHSTPHRLETAPSTACAQACLRRCENVTYGRAAERFEYIVAQGYALDRVWRDPNPVLHQRHLTTHRSIEDIVLVPGSNLLVASVRNQERTEWALTIYSSTAYL